MNHGYCSDVLALYRQSHHNRTRYTLLTAVAAGFMHTAWRHEDLIEQHLMKTISIWLLLPLRTAGCCAGTWIGR